jgi:hypothetical protein
MADAMNGRATSAPLYRHRNRISGQWSPRLIEMLESPAYRALSLSAHRAMARIEIELASHGGNDNGRLTVTFEDFIAYGIHHNAIAPAIRELEALGFIHVTERGRGGNSEHRQPNKFFLTFAHSRESRQIPPTHDWRKIKTLEEAMGIARAARDDKNPQAVQFAERRTLKTKNRYRNPVVVPHPESGSEIAKSPHPESGSTASPPKPVALSISRVRGCYPRAQSTQPYTDYSSLPLEVRMMALGLPLLDKSKPNATPQIQANRK